MNHLEGIKLNELKIICENNEILKYSELCKRLNIDYLSSNSKTNQLKNLQSLCDFEIVSNPTRYCFKEYYEGANETIKLMRGKYVPYVEALICSKLSINEMWYATKREIAEELGLANPNLFIALNFKNRLPIAEDLKYDFKSFDRFVDESYNCIRPIIRDALNSMQKRYVININKAYKYKRLSKNRDDIVQWEFCNANSKMGQNLLEIENEVLNNLGYEDNQLLSKSQNEIFYRETNRLAIQRYNIEVFFRCNQIISKKEIAVKEYNQLMIGLNDRIQERIKSLNGLKLLKSNQMENYLADMIRLNPTINYKSIVKRNNRY